jgi:hypothetical protein
MCGTRPVIPRVGVRRRAAVGVAHVVSCRGLLRKGLFGHVRVVLQGRQGLGGDVEGTEHHEAVAGVGAHVRKHPFGGRRRPDQLAFLRRAEYRDGGQLVARFGYVVDGGSLVPRARAALTTSRRRAGLVSTRLWAMSSALRRMIFTRVPGRTANRTTSYCKPDTARIVRVVSPAGGCTGRGRLPAIPACAVPQSQAIPRKRRARFICCNAGVKVG